ncbi:iron chaperone [Flavobacterium sp. WC2509]|uniref:iron chaperone n=1 Tax=Flavobacterium sp. WC2509 TaxID=3461406 RepID=UPI0040444E31
MKTDFKSVDEYIQTFPKDIQLLLENVRASIIKKAPEAVESISYGMPAYKTNGKPLVYFAGYKKHIGFYATPTGHSEFANELSNYKQGKGSVQFPIDHPIPYWLIEQIVVFRVKENELKSSKH